MTINRIKIVRYVVLGVLVVFPLSTEATTKQVFQDKPVKVRCYQNGVEILKLTAKKFLPQASGDSYIELETEDGRPMQIRVVGSSTCIVEGIDK